MKGLKIWPRKSGRIRAVASSRASASSNRYRSEPDLSKSFKKEKNPQVEAKANSSLAASSTRLRPFRLAQ
jgi:hypothetical protein